MAGGKKNIPARWEMYNPVAHQVAGTRFLPFKVPLRKEILEKSTMLTESEWFTPALLVEQKPMLKAVIDLTDTNRYYNSNEFTQRGIFYKKINISGGGRIPPEWKLKEFFKITDHLSKTLPADALIGVHCTHGLNRTGYLICKYMVTRMKIDPQEAIKSFEDARGYKMERPIFLHDIQRTIIVPDVPRRTSENTKRFTNWRNEPREPPREHWRRGNNDFNYRRPTNRNLNSTGSCSQQSQTEAENKNYHPLYNIDRQTHKPNYRNGYKQENNWNRRNMTWNKRNKNDPRIPSTTTDQHSNQQ